MADFHLLLDSDQEQAKLIIQQHVADIRPVVGDLLFLLCNQNLSLADIGLVIEQAL